MCAGRVKTLHPGVHGGILAIRGNEEHMAAIKSHNISTIDVVGASYYSSLPLASSGSYVALSLSMMHPV